jgi:hypothetical protein
MQELHGRQFWNHIQQQLQQLETAQTADDVCRILAHERNPYGDDCPCGSADAFFAGSGGDHTPRESLYKAGWRTIQSEAYYYYAMQAPTGDIVTYCEGDIYRGNVMRPEAA